MAENENPKTNETGAAPKKSNLKLAIAAVIVAAAVIAGVLGFHYYGKITATTMSLKKAEGTVDVLNDNGKAVTLRENLKLYSGYNLETMKASFAWIGLDDVKLAKMDEETEVEIQKDGKALEILLQSGNLFFNVTEPLADDETMSIRTSTMLIGIRGTCGWVETGEKDRVFILEGIVEVEAGGKTAAVSAGEMAQVSVDEAGRTEITVQPYAEEYISAFVQAELEEDKELSAAVLAASGLDVLDPPDPADRLRAERQELITAHSVMDFYAAEGVSYTRDGVVYGCEGLKTVFYADLDGDGTEEMVLVTSKAGRRAARITQLEVYGEAMGHILKLDEITPPVWIERWEEGYEEEFIPFYFNLLEKEGRISLQLVYGDGEISFGYYLCKLENGQLALSEDIIRSESEEDDIYTHLDIEDYMGEPSIPELPDDIQRKNGYLRNIDSPQIVPPSFMKLYDIDGDGAEELLALEDNGDLAAYSWNGLEVQRSTLESNVIYAKLIDMDQDGHEELLLLTGRGEYIFKAYSWGEAGMQSKELEYRASYSEYNIYREKETGIIYVGGLDGGGSRGEHTTLCSLTDTLEFSWNDHSADRYRYQNGGRLVIVEPQDIEYLEGVVRREAEEYYAQVEELAIRESKEYYAQLDRFELIEYIDFNSYGWQNSLSYTVEEVKQQLMAR